MVTVAKNLEGPIKLLFPRGGSANPALLGLGDIVIPGLLISLLLRFDDQMAVGKERPFFRASLLAYGIGLGTTIWAMETFKAAQPALIYLVPACLGSALLVGGVKGKLGPLFSYDEEIPEDGAASPEPSKKDE